MGSQILGKLYFSYLYSPLVVLQTIRNTFFIIFPIFLPHLLQRQDSTYKYCALRVIRRACLGLPTNYGAVCLFDGTVAVALEMDLFVSYTFSCCRNTVVTSSSFQ